MTWLDSERAVNWLQSLTGTETTLRDLLDLCHLRHCDAYMNVDDLTGKWIEGGHNEGYGFEGDEEVIGSGMALIRAKGMAYRGEGPTEGLWVEGPVFLPAQPREEGEAFYCTWEPYRPPNAAEVFFRPQDIIVLAHKINGVEGFVNGAKELRAMLDQEGAVRASLEAELLALRAAESKKPPAGIDHTPSPEEFAALQHRAEKAERMVDALERQLVKQAEREQPAGLTFPYTTKTLEAMRRAAAEFWEEYTPDKRQPTQKLVGLTLGELLGLPQQSNGDPARKAIVLASAIRPDHLPSA
ncbi:MAG: hypothetical protein ACRBBM_01615 [Pseudomonadaceae bacterium]